MFEIGRDETRNFFRLYYFMYASLSGVLIQIDTTNVRACKNFENQVQRRTEINLPSFCEKFNFKFMST